MHHCCVCRGSDYYRLCQLMRHTGKTVCLTRLYLVSWSQCVCFIGIKPKSFTNAKYGTFESWYNHNPLPEIISNKVMFWPQACLKRAFPHFNSQTWGQTLSGNHDGIKMYYLISGNVFMAKQRSVVQKRETSPRECRFNPLSYLDMASEVHFRRARKNIIM